MAMSHMVVVLAVAWVLHAALMLCAHLASLLMNLGFDVFASLP
jgi:hypothetical protein